MGAASVRLRRFVLLPAYILGAGVFAVNHLRRSPEEWLAAGPAFVRSVAALPADANAYVPFPTAGAAIWYGFPRGVRVFGDSRNDCYSAGTFVTFLLLEADATPPAACRAALVTTGTDAAVIPRAHPMAAFLARSQNLATRA